MCTLPKVRSHRLRPLASCNRRHWNRREGGKVRACAAFNWAAELALYYTSGAQSAIRGQPVAHCTPPCCAKQQQQQQRLQQAIQSHAHALSLPATAA